MVLGPIGRNPAVPLRSASPPVDLATVADTDDHDDQLRVTDLVEHAVLADPDPPESLGAATCEELRAGRTRVRGEVSDRDAYALARRIRES